MSPSCKVCQGVGGIVSDAPLPCLFFRTNASQSKALNDKVTTCLVNLEMSGNLIALGEMLGVKNLVVETVWGYTSV